jgi:heme o synthase
VSRDDDPRAPRSTVTPDADAPDIGLPAASADAPAPGPGPAGHAPRGADGTPSDALGPMHESGRYERRTSGTLDTVRRYVLVTKPRIIELLLVTTVPAMVVAAGGWPDTWLVLATLVGGTMGAGSANALNNYVDRDVDRLMARTSGRPTARDEVSPTGALVLGVVLGIAGFVWLLALVNLVAALLVTAAILFYVFVYTLGLKRRTSQAVVIGGAAGCVPVLTGWAAVTGGSLADPRPWLLFAIVFWWTPPHFWALAMKYRDDYARAGLPMLPVTHGNDETTRHILLYSWLLLSIVLLYVAGAGAGWLFSTVAVGLTVGWLVLAHRLRRDRTVPSAMRLFHYSTIYLALVFVAAAVDAEV